MDVQSGYADWLRLQRSQPVVLETVFADGTGVMFSVTSHETGVQPCNTEAEESDFD